jgi:manganese transport protein
LISFGVIPIVIAAGLLLLYITFRPLFQTKHKVFSESPHGDFKKIVAATVSRYKRIAVAVDFSKTDEQNINNALTQGGKNAQYLLIHVVESAGALMMSQDIRDYEYLADVKYLKRYAEQLKEAGYEAEIRVGYGNPKRAIPRLVKEFDADLLVMGAHGHKGFKDFLLGTTVDSVRHKVEIPVLIVRNDTAVK